MFSNHLEWIWGHFRSENWYFELKSGGKTSNFKEISNFSIKKSNWTTPNLFKWYILTSTLMIVMFSNHLEGILGHFRSENRNFELKSGGKISNFKEISKFSIKNRSERTQISKSLWTVLWDRISPYELPNTVQLPLPVAD